MTVYKEKAHKLVTTRRAIENKGAPHSQVQEPGASSNPPEKGLVGTSPFFPALWWRGLTGILKGREGKGYIAVPACGGSLAEAKRACNQTSPN
eukprot:1137724-Pelagomonas_calceolata.AAC.5